MGKKVVLTGNYSASEAAALCRPDLIALIRLPRSLQL